MSTNLPYHPTHNPAYKATASVRRLNERDDLQLVTDYQDCEPIRDHVGDTADEFDAFLVKVDEGEYVEVWGIEGIIPAFYKTAYRIL